MLEMRGVLSTIGYGDLDKGQLSHMNDERRMIYDRHRSAEADLIAALLQHDHLNGTGSQRD